jgi:hypothetical protein
MIILNAENKSLFLDFVVIVAGYEWLERSYAILYRVKEDMNLPIVHVVKYLVFDLHVGMLIRDIRLEDF